MVRRPRAMWMRQSLRRDLGGWGVPSEMGDSVCVCPSEARDIRFPWRWSYRWLWPTWQGCFAITVPTPNPLTISTNPLGFFFFNIMIFCSTLVLHFYVCKACFIRIETFLYQFLFCFLLIRNSMSFLFIFSVAHDILLTKFTVFWPISTSGTLKFSQKLPIYPI